MADVPFLVALLPFNARHCSIQLDDLLFAPFLVLLDTIDRCAYLRERALCMLAYRNIAVAHLLAQIICGLRASEEEHADKDRKSTRLNSSHANTSYAVFCLK